MNAFGGHHLRFALPTPGLSEHMVSVGFPFGSHKFEDGRGCVVSVEVSKLTEDFILEFAPTLVISPVICRKFDCVELAGRLSEIGYSGLYVAISRDLPRLDIIRTEVRSMVTGVTFDVADLSDISRAVRLSRQSAG